MKSIRFNKLLLLAALLVALSAPGVNAQTSEDATVRPELAIERTADYDYDPPEPGTYSLPVIKEAADGHVLDSEGRLRSLRTLAHGRVTVLSFIYLRCRSPKACPYATGILRQVHEVSRQDAGLAGDLQLITMSFDPAHDTPERMAGFANVFRQQGGAEWRFLTTRSKSELKPILEAYDQVVDARGNMNDPLGPFFHPVRVYLIDGHGRIRNIYSLGTLDPRLIVTDARTLLMEEQAQLAHR